MTKKVYKYGTGDIIPEGAVYLSTQVETKEFATDQTGMTKIKENILVWHYFLVEEDLEVSED